MATAPRLQGPKPILHVRGSWPARDDRTASAVWLAILWLGMLLGFGLDFHRFLQEAPPAPRVLYVHAVIFTGWMLLLTAQVLLVLRDRVALHRRLGWFLVGWACLMAVFGPWAAMASLATTADGTFTGTAFLSVNGVDIGGFLVLLAWGVLLRKNPAAHRRMMILSTISLADPGFDRAFGHLFPFQPHSAIVWFICVFYGNVLLIALMAGWDLWRGRLMRSFVIGACGLLAAELLASFLYFWPPWHAFTLSLVQLWARHFA